MPRSSAGQKDPARQATLTTRWGLRGGRTRHAGGAKEAFLSSGAWNNWGLGLGLERKADLEKTCSPQLQWVPFLLGRLESNSGCKPCRLLVGLWGRVGLGEFHLPSWLLQYRADEGYRMGNSLLKTPEAVPQVCQSRQTSSPLISSPNLSYIFA